MKHTEPELLPAQNQPTYQPPRQAVVKHEVQPLAHSPPAELNISTIADRILTGEITNEKLGMIKELVAMDAERKFSTAFVALQNEMPTIVAKTVIPNRGKYEKFEDVMDTIAPFLTKHGFSVSFSNDFKENRIVETCHLSHIGGHTRANSFTVRVGKADSETQADCKAATTAKRNALLNALNIVIRQDCLNEEHDARLEGGFITAEQSDELERRIKMVNGDVAKFLKFADAKTFDTIHTSKYPLLDEMLRKKEGGK